MKKYIYGDSSSSNVLVQMVDEHDLAAIENEAALIGELCGTHFCLTALQVDRWSQDLTPWEAPAVFGREDFGSGAKATLEAVLSELGLDSGEMNRVRGMNSDMEKLARLERYDDNRKRFYIGGYSLAGLFALWSVYQTDVFSGAAAASPSVWYPGFLDYMKEHELPAGFSEGPVYLSLGDREEKTRNPYMSTVGTCIREAYTLLNGKGVNCILEWNKGNHFRDTDLRTAKAFAWVLRTCGQQRL